MHEYFLFFHDSTAQVLTTALLQATLLGLVYSRFASPATRAVTIRFSSVLAMYREADGLFHLAFRVANLRRHQVLQPDVRMLMMRLEPVCTNGPWEFRYHELPLTQISGRGRLWLGVPSVMAHAIDRSSPLWGITRDDLERCDCEFIVLLDGIDESTSTAMQARHSYFATDIRWGRAFAGVLARAPSGNLTADYSRLDLTRLAQGPDDDGGILNRTDSDSDDDEERGLRSGKRISRGPSAEGVRAAAAFRRASVVSGRLGGHAAVGAM